MSLNILDQFSNPFLQVFEHFDYYIIFFVAKHAV
jgi:hypothetical protein